MKKIILFILIVIFSFTSVKAQSINDLKNELNKLEKDYQKNENEKQLTKEEIKQTEDKVIKIKSNIEQIYSDIDTLNEEIDKLNDDIKSRDKEMKEIISFVQVSNGESAYLEYLFGARDFTDFVYRMVISEQMTSYNKKLINDYNQMIVENNNKTKKLNESENELKSKQDELSVELNKLGNKLSNISDTSISIQDDIKAQKETIKMYEDMGCSSNEDISICSRKIIKGISDVDIIANGLYRPFPVGVVTSEWGTRWGKLHEGIDLSNSTTHIPVYSIGTGVVASIIERCSCGGNMVIAHYNINNEMYTVVYAHLYSIDVSVGQILSPNTQVGIMGGGDDTTWYDGCTFGDHLHLGISTGLYGIDYSSWSELSSRSFNPRSMINFPNINVFWYTR